MVLKEFDIELDVKRSSANRPIEVVEGDNGNRLNIILTDNGEPVDLTGCFIVAVFAKTDGTTVQQDNGGHGIAMSEAQNNQFTIDLYTSSFAPGLIECEILVFSGENQDTQITSAKFNFTCRRSIMNEDTVQATDEYPILVELIQRTEAVEEGLSTIDVNESTRQSNEALRISQEESRDNAEDGRLTAEAMRVSAESARAIAEQARVIAESGRVSADSARVTAESGRVSAESARASAESSRVSAETARDGAEDIRESNELARIGRDTAFRVWENYDNSKAYVPLNKVQYNGSSYICIANTTGNAPPNATYWQLIAAKGLDGEGAGDMLASVYAASEGVVKDSAKLMGYGVMQDTILLSGLSVTSNNQSIAEITLNFGGIYFCTIAFEGHEFTATTRCNEMGLGFMFANIGLASLVSGTAVQSLFTDPDAGEPVSFSPYTIVSLAEKDISQIPNIYTEARGAIYYDENRIPQGEVFNYQGNKAPGADSSAHGRFTTASGLASTAMGLGTTASADFSTIAGIHGETEGDDLFAVANGDPINQSLAFQVKDTGDTLVHGNLTVDGAINSPDVSDLQTKWAQTNTQGYVTGASPNYTATHPDVTSYYTGLRVMLQFGAGTAGTVSTININGLGAKPVYTAKVQPLKVVDYEFVEFWYDGTYFFQVNSGGGIDLPDTPSAGDTPIYAIYYKQISTPTTSYTDAGTGYGFTSLVSGTFRIRYSAQQSTTTVGYSAYLRLVKNGAEVSSSVLNFGEMVSQNKSIDVAISAGDIIKLQFCFANSGGGYPIRIHYFTVALLSTELQAAINEIITPIA